jgi:hypothetical protein
VNESTTDLWKTSDADRTSYFPLEDFSGYNLCRLPIDRLVSLIDAKGTAKSGFEFQYADNGNSVQ